MKENCPHPDFVFEASWEVCNKWGGIYTVVTSKALLMKSHYDQYYLIGPLFDKTPSEFLPQQPSESLQRVFTLLAQEGIRCVYGLWDIPGKPSTILINAQTYLQQINDIKTLLYETYGIDSLNARHDFHEPLAWAWGVGRFIHQLQQFFPQKHIVGHFHEWLAGFGALYLHHVQAPVATVFTTHATMLGRTLSANNQELFSQLETIDADAVARQLNVQEKHTTEKACAKTAHVFTTVSPITAKECNAFFGVMPDILPNGLAIDTFPTFEETSFLHFKYKEKITEYLMSHFFPYQTFDLGETLLFYFGGRYEYKNKGLDIIIESLAKLNYELQQQQSKKTIVMFFFVAIKDTFAKRELLENKNYVEGLINTVHEKSDYLLQRIILDVLLGENQSIEIMPEHYVKRLRQEFSYVRREGNPPLCTHQFDEANDPTLNHLRSVGLSNKPEDRVKIVFMPTYLDGRDGLLNLEYYEAISACHLGIFPSYYEPWGYTPLESIAHGVPAVTTNTAGFGRYIKEEVVGIRNGLYILNRMNSDQETTEELFSKLKEFVSFDRNERVNRKLNAHSLATYADWRQLVKQYLEAHCNALEKLQP